MTDDATPLPADFERAKAEFLAGLARHEASDFVQAERHYAASLRLVPGRPSTLINLAATQLRLGHPLDALASADAALATEPDSPEALLHRGTALAELGRAADALATFEQLTALAPDHALAWSHRGSLLREMNRHHDAAAAFREALRLGADPGLTQALGQRPTKRSVWPGANGRADVLGAALRIALTKRSGVPS